MFARAHVCKRRVKGDAQAGGIHIYPGDAVEGWDSGTKKKAASHIGRHWIEVCCSRYIMALGGKR